MKRDDIAAFPYTNAEITAKIDFTPDYAAAICYLLEHGEERLLIAIERGLMPANIAMEIARAPDGDVEQLLQSRPVHRRAGEPTVIISGAQADPAFVPLLLMKASQASRCACSELNSCSSPSSDDLRV